MFLGVLEHSRVTGLEIRDHIRHCFLGIDVCPQACSYSSTSRASTVSDGDLYEVLMTVRVSAQTHHMETRSCVEEFLCHFIHW